MTRAVVAIVVAGLLAGAVSAAESEQLDEAFFEYLAELEDGSDDWTWFADDKDEETPAKPAASPKQPVKRTSADKVDP